MTPEHYAEAGCCKAARYIVTYMPKNTRKVAPLAGGGIEGPDRDAWAISSEFHHHRINYCPFCGTPAANIVPHGRSAP